MIGNSCQLQIIGNPTIVESLIGVLEKMYLLDQRILGIAFLILLGTLVTVKQVATGSILDRPQGDLLARLVNIFNLFFLFVVNPLAAILLIARRLATIDPTHLTIAPPKQLSYTFFCRPIDHQSG